MKRAFYIIFLSALFNFLLANSTYAQTDTLLLTPLKSAKLNFTQQLGFQSRLFNGVKYPEYKTAYVGNAYYLSSGFQNAYLHYDDADFYNVPILFDIYKNLVIISYSADAAYMSLLNSKLDKFIVSGHTFIKIAEDSQQKTLKTGFYELLYPGKSQLLAMHSKDIQEEKEGISIKYYFSEHTKYYLKKNNEFYSVSGESSILSVFKDRKKELEAFIKTNNIDFKNNAELALAKVASYYDELKK